MDQDRDSRDGFIAFGRLVNHSSHCVPVGQCPDKLGLHHNAMDWPAVCPLALTAGI